MDLVQFASADIIVAVVVKLELENKQNFAVQENNRLIFA
jgi:hypothetical protein